MNYISNVITVDMRHCNTVTLISRGYRRWVLYTALLNPTCLPFSLPALGCGSARDQVHPEIPGVPVERHPCNRGVRRGGKHTRHPRDRSGCEHWCPLSEDEVIANGHPVAWRLPAIPLIAWQPGCVAAPIWDPEAHVRPHPSCQLETKWHHDETFPWGPSTTVAP